MAKTNLNIRTDKDIKDQAEVIFSELGLNMTTAINMFLRTIIRENGIPFNLKLEIQFVKIENYFYKKEYEKGIDYYLSIANVEKENLKKYALLNQEVMWLVVASNVGNLETFEKAKEKINKLEELEIYRKIKY